MGTPTGQGGFWGSSPSTASEGGKQGRRERWNGYVAWGLLSCLRGSAVRQANVERVGHAARGLQHLDGQVAPAVAGHHPCRCAAGVRSSRRVHTAKKCSIKRSIRCELQGKPVGPYRRRRCRASAGVPRRVLQLAAPVVSVRAMLGGEAPAVRSRAHYAHHRVAPKRHGEYQHQGGGDEQRPQQSLPLGHGFTQREVQTQAECGTPTPALRATGCRNCPCSRPPAGPASNRRARRSARVRCSL